MITKRLTRDVLTFYNGKVLFDQGKPHHFTRTSSSIRHADFYRREAGPAFSRPCSLLYAGRLAPEKGISYLLEAVGRLTDDGVPVELHIAGDGALGGDLRREARERKVADRIHFRGQVPPRTVQQLCRESDMLVLPSVQDLQPKVLLEAMSQGTPVIATDVGAVSSLVQDRVNGLLVPPGCTRALVDAIKLLIGDAELRRGLVREGLACASVHTVEMETARMMRVVTTHFGRNKTGANVDIQEPHSTIENAKDNSGGRVGPSNGRS